jgi:peptidoglycan/LPS O-acetylase OafA/YrhL
MQESARQTSYVPAIDGLRCLAVAGVVCTHLGYLGPLSLLGWTGVWLFFVISGFVITSSIMGPAYRELSFAEQLRTFWVRRARRILPLYFLFVALGVYIASFNKTDPRWLEQLPYLLTFTYNFYRLSPDYKDDVLFSHYWSLSVEEQFYLVFPLVFFTLAPQLRQRVLIAVVVLGPLIRWLVGAWALGAYGTAPAAGNAVYLISPGHFDAFALGALIALNRERIAASRHVLPLAAAGSLALLAMYLLACVVVAPGIPAARAIEEGLKLNTFGGFRHVALYTLLNVLFATAIVAVLKDWRPLTSALELSWMRYLGRMSYGIYVVHLPLMILFLSGALGPGTHIAEPLGLAMYLTMLLLVCHLLHVGFERPIMQARLPRPAAA